MSAPLHPSSSSFREGVAAKASGLLARCRDALVALAALAVAGCEGPQSALDPAGEGAERIAVLWWCLLVGAVGVWSLMVGLLTYSVRVRSGPHDPWTVKLWVIGGGAFFPTVVLTGTLVGGLALLPDLLEPAPPGSLKIEVVGEQYWWRVRYLRESDAGAETTERIVDFETANEIRLPVGEPVEFHLESADVIHAFWIPPLGGKVDMIPGRHNRLTLLPTRTGTFRGQCAEFCGESHALMALDVVVAEQDEFDRWRERERSDAPAPSEALAAQGQEVFLARGCGACHTVRGTRADGVVGPDLTHVGGRLRIGASLLETDPEAFVRWIAHPDAAKPGVQMPSFDMLSREELAALAAYLEGLR